MAQITNRFVDNALSELQDANRSPIFGFQHLPLMTLEKTITRIIPLVPEVTTYVPLAKQHCNRSSLLSVDESAAIYLYSMPTGFFGRLNETLRDKNRDALKPWFAYLRLFLHALEKLPSHEILIWRGVQGDVGSSITENTMHTWWSVNSCTTALNVVELYLGNQGTVFAINATNAKDISAFSTFSGEKEFILLPGSQVRIKSGRLNFKNALFIVHLEEGRSSSSENPT